MINGYTYHSAELVHWVYTTDLRNGSPGRRLSFRLMVRNLSLGLRIQSASVALLISASLGGPVSGLRHRNALSIGETSLISGRLVS